MGNLIEIQKAIEQLSTEEKEELRQWFDAGTDANEIESQWIQEAHERLKGITSGKQKTIDAIEVLIEGRRIADR